MKAIFISLFFSFIFLVSAAQDTIVFRSGERIAGKVVKVTSQTLEYQRADIPDGPVYSKGFDEVQMVIYQNGKRDVFTLPSLRDYSPRDRHDRHRDDRSTIKSPQKTKVQSIIMTTIGTALLAGGATALIYGITQFDLLPIGIGAVITAGGIPFTIIGTIKISRANRQLNGRRPVNFDSEVGFNPVLSPVHNLSGTFGFNAGAALSFRF